MKMMKLHPHARPLASWEKRYLRENHKVKSFQEMADDLNVSKTYIIDRLVDMGLHEINRVTEPTGGFKKSKINSIFNSKFKLEFGKTYRIVENYGYPTKTDLFAEHTLEGDKRAFIGKLVQVTDELIVLDNGKFKECVNKKDLLTGDYSIREVN